MNELEIRVLDPFDADQLAVWHGVHAASQRFGREELATVWTLPELTVAMQHPGRGRWHAGYVGQVGGEAVVSGYVTTPLLDNQHLAEVAVDVLPERRRQGLGTAMLGHVEAVARHHERSVVLAEANWPYDGGPASSPGGAFAARHGFEVGLVDVKRLLRLPVDGERLEALAAQAASHHAAYTLRSWVGPTPDDVFAGRAELAASLMTEAPTGDLELEPESVDLEGSREREELLARQGRTKYGTVALDAGGTVVAFTEVVTTVHEPGKSYQWGTLVRRADRGHRLGLAVKVANLLMLQRERPDIEQVVTWNAEVNAHMVGVNALLGFVPLERSGELQKRLA